ncbi:Hypothetical protein, putative [Bodo saltans]|uniref:Uncharacterized protein n=1 Tax=Bodo saltans TaxID=75058 RepID=A0A0S4JMJ4_BODSA|nr:Hypothetical protein, putative [Bodo saltans]|eukprot:CUG89725.1 Hypothetical protein, putative [Bodo saltans]
MTTDGRFEWFEGSTDKFPFLFPPPARLTATLTCCCSHVAAAGCFHFFADPSACEVCECLRPPPRCCSVEEEAVADCVDSSLLP